jgi:multimeric flavodoxin WrbA
MKILGINGSPRIGGNTDILLDKALEGAKNSGAQTEKIILNSLNFTPCQECENLRDDGSCIIEDDMQPLYKKIEGADALILASPIFFGSLSAQAKMMIDRFQCAWRGKYIFKREIFSARGGSAFGGKKKKAGAFISVAASNKKDFFDNAKSIVKNFFATVNADYREEIFCRGVEKKGDILKHPQVLNKAYELGEKITKKGA